MSCSTYSWVVRGLIDGCELHLTTRLEAGIIRLVIRLASKRRAVHIFTKKEIVYLPGRAHGHHSPSARGPRETGEPPNACMSWSHLIYHWRSAAGHSKVRGETREDPRATGSRLSPSGSGRMTMMRGRSLTLLVKPLMPDVYQIPRGASVGGASALAA